jgi:hypothetical protein
MKKSKKPAPLPLYDCAANWAQFEQWNREVNQRLAALENAVSATRPSTINPTK